MKKNIVKLVIAIVLTSILCVFSACSTPDNDKSYKISFNTLGGSQVETISVAKGDKVNIAVVPTKNGYDFIGWFFDAETTQKINFNSFTLRKDITIYAGWIDSKQVAHKVKTTPNPLGNIFFVVGIVTEQEVSAKFMQEVTVNVYPIEGYKAQDGSLCANGVPIINNKFVMGKEDVLVTVTYVKEQYSITSYASDGGEIVFDKESAYMEETITYIAIPNVGYYLKEITLDGTVIQNGSFIMPPHNSILIPLFEKINVDVKLAAKVAPTTNGRVTLGKNAYATGEIVAPIIEPQQGYMLKKIVANGKEFVDSFTMPKEDVLITAEFIAVNSENIHNITIVNSPNGTVTVGANTYCYGEKVAMSVIPNSGYQLSLIKINATITGNEWFTMPNEDVEITPIFVKIEEKITIAPSVGGTITTDPIDCARVGQIVKVIVKVDDRYVYKENSLTINGKPIKNNCFVMESGATIRAEFIEKPVGAGSVYDIWTNGSLVGGDIIINGGKTQAKFGERIDLTIIPEVGYRLKKGTLTCNDVPLTDNYFIMQNGDAYFKAEFERVYKINNFYGDYGYVIADVNEASDGDTINFAAYPIYGYSFSQASYNGTVVGVNKTSFVMPAKDVTLNAVFKEISLTSAYSVKIKQGIVEGNVTVSESAVAKDILVTITATPKNGYRVKNFYYIAENTTDKIMVPDAFKMPNVNITVGADFEQDPDVVFSLRNAYEQNREVLACELNVYPKYSINAADIHAYLASYNVGYLAGSVDEILSYNDDYHITALHCTSNVASSELAQTIQYFGDNYKNYSVQVIDNTVYISDKSVYNDCPYMVINRLEVCGDFLLYERADGTYGIYKYLKRSNMLIVPEEYNGRIVSKLSSYALSNTNDILTDVALSNIEILDDKAFAVCDKLTQIDVSRINYLGDIVFFDNRSLTTFLSYGNKNVFVEKNVLYKKIRTGVALIAYPIARTETSVEISNLCSQIEPYAFFGTQIATITNFSNSLVNTIGAYAFANATNLTALDLKSVARIDERAFNGVYNFGEIVLDNIMYIGENAFSIGEKDLVIHLGRSYTIGSELPIAIDGGGNLTIYVKVSQIDNIRTSLVWSNYSSSIYYSTENISGVSGIYFEGNGGSYTKCQLVKLRETAVEPTAPTKEGYAFGGWFSDVALRNSYDFKQMVTLPNIRLYAKWNKA